MSLSLSFITQNAPLNIDTKAINIVCILSALSLLQHITYNEWLPLVLGLDTMDQLDILPLTSGYSNKYSASINPTIINSFATAAFRFGHTLVQGMLE